MESTKRVAAAASLCCLLLLAALMTPSEAAREISTPGGIPTEKLICKHISKFIQEPCSDPICDNDCRHANSFGGRCEQEMCFCFDPCPPPPHPRR